MAKVIRLVLMLAITAFATPSLAQAEPAKAKPRVLVLTDIENEPDDAQSLVRFLLYANQWDVEGLVATTSVHKREAPAAWRIREILTAYGEVRDNLERHEAGFPTADRLSALVREGQPTYGLAAIGAGRETDGSRAIIEAVNRDDPRPLWVLVWGGPNTLAQALWQVRETRGPEETARFVSRL
ncbi:MAG: DUF1593 domain-containing protein, partial [Caulobacter sp.]